MQDLGYGWLRRPNFLCLLENARAGRQMHDQKAVSDFLEQSAYELLLLPTSCYICLRSVKSHTLLGTFVIRMR
jgi:hypothetical protein